MLPSNLLDSQGKTLALLFRVATKSILRRYPRVVYRLALEIKKVERACSFYQCGAGWEAPPLLLILVEFHK